MMFTDSMELITLSQPSTNVKEFASATTCAKLLTGNGAVCTGKLVGF